jgi:hypothetical protein
MTQRLPEILTRSLSSRWRQFVVLLALFFVLTFLLILAAPSILSSNLAQNRLKATLSTALHGPVNWDSLQLSWSQGLQLHNLAVGPTTGTLHQVRLAKIDCRPGFGFGTNPGKSFGLDLFLRLQDLQLDLAPPLATAAATEPSSPTKEEKPDPLTALAQGLDRFATQSWLLPVDLRVDIVIEPFILSYHDPESDRRLHMEEGKFEVKMPSLEQAPLTVSLSGNLAADGHPLGPLRLATEISGLVAPSGRIVPAKAYFSTFVDFPGLIFKTDGRLDQAQGLQSKLNLDLRQLQQVVAPFLPTTLPQISGTLLANLQARIDNEKNLALSLTLAGNKLQADTVGPLDFDLGQQIRTDHQRQSVTLGGGVLMIPNLLEANWEAQVEQPGSSERHVKAKLHHLELDLDQALDLVAPFLPPDLPQITGGQLQLHDLELQLNGSQGAGEVRLARIEVLLPSLRLVQPRKVMTVEGFELVSNDLHLPLSAYFPTSASAVLVWKVAGLQLSGDQPLTVTEVAGNGNLEIGSIRKGEGAGKIIATGSFDHQLQTNGVEAAGVARFSTLDNNLHLVFALLPDGGITVELLKVNTGIAALTAIVAGKELPPIPLSQTLRVEGVALPLGESLPSVNSFTFSITSPDLVKVSVSGNLAADKLLSVRAQSRLELLRFIALTGALLPEKLSASGAISTELQLVAAIPDRPLPAGQPPLRSAKNALAALQELNGSLQLDDVELRLPLTDGNLHVSGIQTSRPFHLHSSNHGEKIDLGGDIAFDLRTGSSINGQVLPVEHGRITFSGEVRDWERAFLAEAVQIEPLGLTQHSELTITGLAALLDQPLPPSPAILLQRLNATLFSEIDLDLRTDAPQLLPDMVFSGQGAAGTRVDLRGGESLRLHAYADFKDLAVTIPDGAEVHGLQAHFNLDRTLQISTATTRQERWLPLSTSLIQPRPLPLPALLEGARRRLHDDRRGSSGDARSLTIETLSLPGLDQPLTIRAIEAEIVTGQEEAGMNFLQAELLGGTLRSRALLDLRPGVPVLRAEALFTNLDLSRLNRDPATPESKESMISGEGFLRIPLLEERRALLEGLSLSARLRQIGAESLDRVLATLDPYERNEAIMAQRKLLRLGQLLGIEVQAADGALGLSGAVNVKGASIALPKIDRLRLAELPLEKELAPLLTAISAVRPPLEFIRADTIVIDAQGNISLRKEEK